MVVDLLVVVVVVVVVIVAVALPWTAHGMPHGRRSYFYFWQILHACVVVVLTLPHP